MIEWCLDYSTVLLILDMFEWYLDYPTAESYIIVTNWNDWKAYNMMFNMKMFVIFGIILYTLLFALKIFSTCELDVYAGKSSLLMKCPPFQHDKERLSVCSHFSWLDDDEVLIRKGPCQINLKKTPTKSMPLRWMTRQLSGLTLEKKWNQTFLLQGLMF